MACTLSAIALVGALAMLRDAAIASQTIDDRGRITNYAVSKLEEQLALVAANWSVGTSAGDFAEDGHPDVRFVATRSDAAGDGGIDDRLMHVQVTTFLDADGDDVLDAEEKQCRFRTKVGKFTNYEALANP